MRFCCFDGWCSGVFGVCCVLFGRWYSVAQWHSLFVIVYAVFVYVVVCVCFVAVVLLMCRCMIMFASVCCCGLFMRVCVVLWWCAFVARVLYLVRWACTHNSRRTHTHTNAQSCGLVCGARCLVRSLVMVRCLVLLLSLLSLAFACRTLLVA